jgi:hypothetical protein
VNVQLAHLTGALGSWSAPRLVLMRCVTSSEVVLDKCSLLSTSMSFRVFQIGTLGKPICVL